MTSAYHPGCTTLGEGEQKLRIYILSKTLNLDCSIYNSFYNYYWIYIWKKKKPLNYVNPQNLEILGTPSSINSDGCSNLPESGLTYPSNLLSNWKMFWVPPWSFCRQTFKYSFIQRIFVEHPLSVIIYSPPKQETYDTAISMKAMLWNSSMRCFKNMEEWDLIVWRGQRKIL